jgi:hypothetical protein
MFKHQIWKKVPRIRAGVKKRKVLRQKEVPKNGVFPAVELVQFSQLRINDEANPHFRAVPRPLIDHCFNRPFPTN